MHTMDLVKKFIKIVVSNFDLNDTFFFEMFTSKINVYSLLWKLGFCLEHALVIKVLAKVDEYCLLVVDSLLGHATCYYLYLTQVQIEWNIMEAST